MQVFMVKERDCNPRLLGWVIIQSQVVERSRDAGMLGKNGFGHIVGAPSTPLGELSLCVMPNREGGDPVGTVGSRNPSTRSSLR